MTESLQEFKAQFHRSKKYVALNNAGSAPFPRPTLVALEVWARKFHEQGPFAAYEAFPEVTRTRQQIGKFLGAKEEEVIFFQNTSQAISQVAFGVKLSAGDEILTWDQEYPSNFYPWRVAAERAGAKLVVAESGPNLETPLDRLLEKVTDRTKVIAVSWVQFRTGAISDLATLASFAKPRGIFTCADIIQGAGVLPFNFEATGLDAACTGSHKWLMSPHGIGVLLLKREHQQSFAPIEVGAMTYGTPDDHPTLDKAMRDDVKRFEPGTQPLLGLVGMGASIELLDKTGISLIAQEAEWLARKLVHGLRELGYVINSPHGAHHRGAIVNFSPGADSPLKTMEAIEARLLERAISFAPRRRPGVRLSPHAFNTIDEIEYAIESLSK